MINEELKDFFECLNFEDSITPEGNQVFTGYFNTPGKFYSAFEVIFKQKQTTLQLLDSSGSCINLMIYDRILTPQEILQTILESYDGTIILVSHDRFLISALTLRGDNPIVQP